MPITQVIWGPSNEYSVVDNGTAPTTATNAGAPIGYDVKPGASGQGVNTYQNGTIPGFVSSATSIGTGTVLANLKYKNPA